MSTGIRKRIVFLRGGGDSKPFDEINEFNVYWGFSQLKALKSIFADTYPYCLLSKSCFEKIKTKSQYRSTQGPLPEDLPDKLKPFVPDQAGKKHFIVVEHLPLPEDVFVDCNISIIFTGQIRDKLEVIIEERRRHLQHLLREATRMELAEESKAAHEEGEKGGETWPNGKQADDEDVDYGDWVVVESDPPL